MLSKRFRVERRLVSHFGAAKTLGEKPQVTPKVLKPEVEKSTDQLMEELPFRKAPKPEAAEDFAVNIEDDIKLLTQSVKKEIAQNVSQETAPKDLPEDATGEWENIDIDLESELKSQIQSEITETIQDYDKSESKIDPQELKDFEDEILADPEPESMIIEEEEPVLDISEACADLHSLLMEPKNSEYFIENLFEGDQYGFKVLADKICNSTDLNRALIIADNELFLLDIAPSSEAASKLLNTVRANFSR